MNKFSTINTLYEQTLKSPKRIYGVKIEILSYNESAIREMTLQAIRDVVGSIEASYQQLTRRTCTLHLLHYDENITDFIKYGDKFNLYLGLLVGNDVYWFPQGVFMTTNATRYRDYFSIEGVDKGGVLDGSVGLNIADVQYRIEVGSNVRQAIIDTLGHNFEQHIDKSIHSSTLSRPVDPKNPFVDLDYGAVYTQTEYSIDSNAPIGELLISLADGYGANVWYDLEGRLNFTHNVAFMSASAYNRLPIKWIFDDRQVAEAQYTTRSDTKNAVTVYTNSDIFENVSVTVYNTNPASPNRIDLIGVRRLDSVEIPYTKETPEEERARCTSHGEYLLSLEEFNQNSINMTTIMIPHLDVGDRIIYGDDSFLIQSLSLRLDGTDMEIAGTQI